MGQWSPCVVFRRSKLGDDTHFSPKVSRHYSLKQFRAVLLSGAPILFSSCSNFADLSGVLDLTLDAVMTSKPASRKTAPRGEYIETDTGNKISRRSKIEGAPHIVLAGRVVVSADACLRGDLCRPPDKSLERETNRTSISVGRYTFIASGATIHPPHRVFRGGDLLYYPMKIGENVFIGANSYISAAAIGSHVYIGRDVVVGNGVLIKDRVKVLDGSILASGMVVPSNVIVGGSPARILDDLPDGWGLVSEDGEWCEGGDLRELIRKTGAQ